MWGSESWNMAQNIYQNIPTRKTPTPKIKKNSHSDPPLLSQNPGSTRGGLFTYLENRICRFSNWDLISWLKEKECYRIYTKTKSSGHWICRKI